MESSPSTTQAKSLLGALQQAQVFTSLSPTIYDELVHHLQACLVNSHALLTLEQQIKQTGGNNSVFLGLCAIFLTHTQQPQVQWVASLLLKNTLKDRIAEGSLRGTEEF